MRRTRLAAPRGFEGAIKELAAATRAYEKSVKRFSALQRDASMSTAAMTNSRRRLQAAQANYQNAVDQVEVIRVAAARSASATFSRANTAESLRGIRLRDEEGVSE